MPVSVCKQCRAMKANRPGTLCHRCFRATGEERRAGSKVPAQLAAIRKAVKVPWGGSHADPRVVFWVRVKEKDPARFAKMLIAEEERWDATRNRRRAARERGLGGAVLPVGVSDGYDAASDTVSPARLEECDRWLQDFRAKFDARLAAEEGGTVEQ